MDFRRGSTSRATGTPTKNRRNGEGEKSLHFDSAASRTLLVAARRCSPVRFLFFLRGTRREGSRAAASEEELHGELDDPRIARAGDRPEVGGAEDGVGIAERR